MSDRKTQREAILGLLVSARGGWIELPEIMRLAAQYGARIFELRRLGFKIENKVSDIGGVRHSWFRLIPCAVRETSKRDAAAPAVQGLLLDWHRDD